MKAATRLSVSRPQYSVALVALAAIHEGHVAFLGGNFVDCSTCKFHATNSSDGEAIEHDPEGNFRRTYAVRDEQLVMIDEWKCPERKIAPSYVELADALARFGDVGLITTTGETLDGSPSNCTCDVHPELTAALDHADELVRRLP